MLSNSTTNQSKNDGNPTKNETKKHNVCLIKGRKPLVKFRFYLDIKSHIISTKIASRIKDLGGTIDLFLIREVTHVVSDRGAKETSSLNSIQSPATPTAAAVFSNESAAESPFTPSESHHRSVPPKKFKSRADAMLERARMQPNVNAIDPLDTARLWGTPIWSVDKILKWLDKVSASIVLPAEELSVLKNKSRIKPTVNITYLKPPYIKFESAANNARPVYQQLPSWPTINLNAAVGESPFEAQNPTKNSSRARTDRGEQKMMRKPRATRISLRNNAKVDENSATIQHGYCEICRVDYDDLSKHVRSETHVNFVQDDANFLSLDSLITAGANVEAFLRLNGAANKELSPILQRRSLRKCTIKNQLDVKVNGDVSSSKKNDKSMGLGQSTPRSTRSSSACEKTTKEICSAPVSPALSDTGHHLRSRGQLWLPSSLLGTTAEDDGNPVKPLPKENVRETRANCKDKDVKNDVSDVESEDEPLSKRLRRHLSNDLNKPLTRNLTRSKRSSGDDGVVLNNRAFYKVEMLSSKLRSNSTREVDVPVTPVPPVEEDVEYNGDATDRLVVKFKRVRNSELSALNKEASNFMFPRRDDELDDCETDDGRQTSMTSQRCESSDLKTSEVDRKRCTENDEYDGSALSSCESETNLSARVRKKRRRTHAEAFISDNEKYYKFETPGSRLRFQGSFLPLMVNVPHCSDNLAKDKTEDDDDDDDDDDAPELKYEEDETIFPDDFTFTFQRIDDTFDPKVSRAEMVAEDFRLFSQFRCQANKNCMPYEMSGRIPPLDPHVCKEAFEKRLKPIDEMQTSGDVTSETNNSGANSVADSSELVTALQANDRNYIYNKLIKKKKRKQKKKMAAQEKNPRKSPRQHASTLAILSGFLNQRKPKTRSSDELESFGVVNLSPIQEQPEGTNSVAASPAYESTSKFIEPDLDVNDDESDVDIDLLDDAIEKYPEKDFSVDFEEKPSFLDILNTYRQCTTLDYTNRGRPRRIDRRYRFRKLGTKLNSLFNDSNSLFARTTKVMRKKNRRKNNRTGWPKRPRRYMFKRDDDKVAEPSDNNMSTEASDLVSSLPREQGQAPIPVHKRKYIRKSKFNGAKALKTKCTSSNHKRKRRGSILSDEVRDCGLKNSTENKENKTQAGSSQASHFADAEEELRSMSSRNGSRNPSIDCLGFSADECAESEKWEHVDSVLNTKSNTTSPTSRRKSIDYQPFVRVQKIDGALLSKTAMNNRRLRSSSSPMRSVQPKSKKVKQDLSPPTSPRKLRKPRGRWYRDR